MFATYTVDLLATTPCTVLTFCVFYLGVYGVTCLVGRATIPASVSCQGQGYWCGSVGTGFFATPSTVMGIAQLTSVISGNVGDKYGVTRWSESRVVRNIDCTFRTWSRFGEGLGVRTRDEAQRLASIRVGVMRSETNSTTPKNALLYFAGEIVPSVQAVDGKRRT